MNVRVVVEFDFRDREGRAVSVEDRPLFLLLYTAEHGVGVEAREVEGGVEFTGPLVKLDELLAMHCGEARAEQLLAASIRL